MHTPLVAIALVPPPPPIGSSRSDQDSCPARDRSADEAVVASYGLLLRGHCRRVYRVVRSILRDPAEIEDVMSHAFVSTFMHAERIEPMPDSTWVCRLALNEALVRLRQRGRFVALDTPGGAAPPADRRRPRGAEAPLQTTDVDIVQSFEETVDQLPEVYRTVLIMREVEGMTVGETAAVLNVDAETVKLRVQQGRAPLKNLMKGYSGEVFRSAFPLDDELEAAITAAVTDALRWTLRLSDRARPSPAASSARATGRA